MKIVFFGSSRVSIYVLEELLAKGFIPRLVVTTPDKPQGRGLVLTANIVKKFATEKGLRVLDPAVLDGEFENILKAEDAHVFIVASYGKIMPKSVVEMPAHGTLNMHPSLLPRYRGAAPLPTTMLDDTKETGISIMRLDEKMDHGPIVATKEIKVDEWPTYEEFEEMMAREGGRLLAEILPDWVGGKIKEVEQDHSLATFTKKIKKEDALIDLGADPYTNFRKIQTYHEWPGAYFFVKKNGRDVRVKINNASFDSGTLNIEKVTPEGSKMMDYRDFLSGYGS